MKTKQQQQLGPLTLHVGDKIRNRLTGYTCQIHHRGIDCDGFYVHCIRQDGETLVFGQSYLANCERI